MNNAGGVGYLRRRAIHSGARSGACRPHRREYRARQWRHHQPLAVAENHQYQRQQRRSGHLDEILADAAFTHFTQTVRLCMAAGVFADGDPLPITLQLWAAAHGIASLMIAKPFLPWGDVEAAADSVLCAAALGRAIGDRLGTDVGPEQFTRWLTTQPSAAG